jgi:hypothetical protein
MSSKGQKSQDKDKTAPLNDWGIGGIIIVVGGSSGGGGR